MPETSTPVTSETSAPGPAAPGACPTAPSPLADGLRMAVGTLTALPVRPPTRTDRDVARVAMLLAPLAGLVPGLAAAAVAAGALLAGASAPLASALAVGTAALATRGLHLDGLADTADGLTASYDRERALDVMRRGNVGPAGAGALVLVLTVQVTALAQAMDGPGPVAVAVAAVIGRSALVLGCTSGVPAARSGGLGAAVAGSVPKAWSVVGLLLVAAAGAAALAPWGAPGVAAGAAATVGAAAAAAALLRRAVARLGGITGDVLGAAVETSTTAALVVLAVAAP
jgi:adenosylcobinamide-GDP ribazoletransferase